MSVVARSDSLAARLQSSPSSLLHGRSPAAAAGSSSQQPQRRSSLAIPAPAAGAAARVGGPTPAEAGSAAQSFRSRLQAVLAPQVEPEQATHDASQGSKPACPRADLPWRGPEHALPGCAASCDRASRVLQAWAIAHQLTSPRASLRSRALEISAAPAQASLDGMAVALSPRGHDALLAALAAGSSATSQAAATAAAPPQPASSSRAGTSPEAAAATAAAALSALVSGQERPSLGSPGQTHVVPESAADTPAAPGKAAPWGPGPTEGGPEALGPDCTSPGPDLAQAAPAAAQAIAEDQPLLSAAQASLNAARVTRPAAGLLGPAVQADAAAVAATGGTLQAQNAPPAAMPGEAARTVLGAWLTGAHDATSAPQAVPAACAKRVTGPLATGATHAGQTGSPTEQPPPAPPTAQAPSPTEGQLPALQQAKSASDLPTPADLAADYDVPLSCQPGGGSAAAASVQLEAPAHGATAAPGAHHSAASEDAVGPSPRTAYPERLAAVRTVVSQGRESQIMTLVTPTAAAGETACGDADGTPQPILAKTQPCLSKAATPAAAGPAGMAHPMLLQPPHHLDGCLVAAIATW